MGRLQSRVWDQVTDQVTRVSSRVIWERSKQFGPYFPPNMRLKKKFLSDFFVRIRRLNGKQSVKSFQAN